MGEGRGVRSGECLGWAGPLPAALSSHPLVRLSLPPTDRSHLFPPPEGELRSAEPTPYSPAALMLSAVLGAG